METTGGEFTAANPQKGHLVHSVCTRGKDYRQKGHFRCRQSRKTLIYAVCMDWRLDIKEFAVVFSTAKKKEAPSGGLPQIGWL